MAAASLAMILGHYGRFVPLEDLRGACGVSRDGARASSVLTAARSYGLVARGYQTEADNLRDLTGPVIIFWAFQHFMVVEGIRTNQLWVFPNPDAAGAVRPRLDELDGVLADAGTQTRDD